MMITTIFIVTALLMVCGDYVAYKRYGRKISLAVVLVAANSLPLLAAAMMWLCGDNSQVIMAIDSWILTLYIALTLTRMALYFGLFICRNRWVGIVAAAVVAVILLNGIINTRTNLTVKHVVIEHERIPRSFDGFKIAFFSDLHIGSMVRPEKELLQLVDKVNSLNADMVIFGGDMLHIRHTELSDTKSAILSRIKAPHGVYSVLGNHDTGTYIKDTSALTMDENVALFSAKIGQMGWMLLRDSTIYAVRGCDSIAVTGIDFTDALLEYKHSFSTPTNFSATEIFAQVPDSLFNIAVSHLPHLWHTIGGGNFAELTLSGHVHATQAAIDLLGYRLSPAMLMYKQWSGEYSEQGNHLYITDGVGCVGFNMRIGAVPEITLIELNR